MNGFGVPLPPDRPGRRINDDEDNEEEVGSNPDELIDENVSDPDEGDGEDLNDNWLKCVV